MSPNLQLHLPTPAVDEDTGDSEIKLVSRCAVHAYRHLVDSLDTIGGIDVAAGVTGMDRGDLRKAIDRTVVGNGVRRIPLEHAMAIGARLARYNPSLAEKLGAAIVNPLGLEVKPIVTITDKERADRLEAHVRAQPYGDRIVADLFGKP